MSRLPSSPRVELLIIEQDIIDLWDIDADMRTSKSVDFDVLNTVTSTVDVFAAKAEQKEIVLVCQVHAEVPRFLRGDPDRLHQVIANLVGNAIKFTERAEVVVGVAREDEQGDRVTIGVSVSDSGTESEPGATFRLTMCFGSPPSAVP